MNQNYNNERNAALDVLRNEMTFMQATHGRTAQAGR